MNYFYDLPDDMIDMINQINLKEFQHDVLNHKFNFGPIQAFIKGRCCSPGLICMNPGAIYHLVSLCKQCYININDICDSLPVVIHSVAPGDAEDEPVNENEDVLAILKKGFGSETHCACEWYWPDNEPICCRMCIDINEDAIGLKQHKYEWYHQLIVYYLDGIETPEVPHFYWYEGEYGDEPQLKLGGLTIKEYIFKYANFKDERFVGWEDERLGPLLEPWVCTFKPELIS